MSAPMIATMAELPRNDQLAEQFELLGDLMELEGADLFRINAYRKAAARIRETPSSVAQLALDGKAKALQGIGKTIEAKIVEVVEDGEIHALTKRKTEVPAEVATFMRLPGLGPKTARRIWQELGITTVDGLKAAAEAQELRGHAGIGPGTEQKIAEALARPRAAEGPHRALLGTTLPKLRAVVQVLQEHEASVEVSLAGSARRMRETVRDLDIIATATDPQALVDYFCSLAGWSTSPPRARPRRRSSRTTGCASTCASCRRRATATCCSTSPARSTTTSRCARTRCVAATRSPSTRSPSSRPARSIASPPRQRSTRFSATTGSRRSCGRTAASSPPRGSTSCLRSSS